MSENENIVGSKDQEALEDLMSLIIQEQLSLLNKRIKVIDAEYKVAALLNIIANICSHTIYTIAKKEHLREAFDEFIEQINDHCDLKIKGLQ